MSKCWKCGEEETTGHFNGRYCLPTPMTESARNTELRAALAAAQKEIEELLSWFPILRVKGFEDFDVILKMDRDAWEVVQHYGKDTLVDLLKTRAEQAEAERDAAVKEVGEIARKLGHAQAERDEAVKVIESLYSCKYEPDKMLCIIQRWRQYLAAKQLNQISPDKTEADEAVCTAPDADQERGA